MFAELIHLGLAVSLAAAAAADKPEDKMALTEKPLTVAVEPTAEIRSALAAAAKPAPKVAVHLVLGGVVPPKEREQIEGVRVFLNKDDATRATSIDDPHFVCAFAFAPTTQRDPQEFNLDLTRTVAELGRQGKLDSTKPLRITLIAVPAMGAKELPAQFSVPVGKVSIKVKASK